MSFLVLSVFIRQSIYTFVLRGKIPLLPKYKILLIAVLFSLHKIGSKLELMLNPNVPQWA